jgi:Nif-specific regulatory protein
MDDIKRFEETTLLYEISKALNEHLDLKKSLYKVLDILSSSLKMERGTITILDPLRNEIHIEVAHGISKSAVSRVKYQLGEGITGRVIQSGKMIVIPKISEEPHFLDRTASRKSRDFRELSFFCTPIKKGNQVVGALSVDRLYDESYNLAGGKKLLSVVATMVAQHVINLETIQREKDQLRDENRRLRKELENKYRITNIIGNSNKMREVFQMISQVSQSNATVLIRGESGTGKELVANSIHYNSHRAKTAFVKVNCAALPSNLIESELFGHELGAFTGAIKQKQGKFELANKGTIFLDEIGSIGLDVQAKLAAGAAGERIRTGRRTQDHQDRRTGHSGHQQESGEAVEDGSFRGDLYYRLNVFPIYMPPCGSVKPICCCWRIISWKNTPGKTVRISAFSTPGHRHAHGLSLARKRPGTGKLHRAGRAALRRRSDPQLSPAADPSNRRRIRHLADPFDGRGRRQSRTGNDHRCPEEHPRQHHSGGRNPPDNGP